MAQQAKRRRGGDGEPVQGVSPGTEDTTPLMCQEYVLTPTLIELVPCPVPRFTSALRTGNFLDLTIKMWHKGEYGYVWRRPGWTNVDYDVMRLNKLCWG